MNRKLIRSAQLLVVVLCALALKLYYSTATPDELRWILAPTTALVELLSGRSFTFESYTGYMSSDHRFVIAISCAGVNFLLTAFLMLGLRRLWRDRLEGVSWGFLPVTAVVAYVTTVIANTVRICIALEIQRYEVQISGLSANQLHRLEGIVVYFGFLLLLFVLAEKRNATPRRRLVVFPLVIYYATTFGVPLLNGSYKQGIPFWEHSLFVLVLPVILLATYTMLAFFVGAALRGRPWLAQGIQEATVSGLANTIQSHGRPRRAAPTVTPNTRQN
jgi:exosortase K